MDINESDFISGVYGNLSLEVDKRRNVLYLHNSSGVTLLRMCRLPAEFIKKLPSKKRNLVLDPDESENSFIVTTEGGEIIFEVKDLPGYILSNLKKGFADITYGFTPASVV